MKKRILSMALLATAIFLASCTDSEVLETKNTPKGAMQFKAFSGKNMNGLKATEINGVNLADISGELGVKCVTKAGTALIGGFEEPLFYDAATMTWNTQNYKYADTVNGLYDFYALYPKEIFADVTMNADEAEFDYTVTPNADVDVLGAAHLGVTGADSRANFQLKHLLTQINYGIILDPRIGHVKITSVKMKGFKSTGTYSLGAVNAWSTLSNPVDYSLLNIDTRGMASTDLDVFAANTWTWYNNPVYDASYVYLSKRELYSKMLIPQTFTTGGELEFEITFEAYEADGTTVFAGVTNPITKTIKIDPMTFLAGNLYSITFDFNPFFDRKPIKYTIAVEDWVLVNGSAEGVDESIYKPVPKN